MKFKKICKVIIVSILIATLSLFFALLVIPSPNINHPNVITYKSVNNDYSETEIANSKSQYVNLEDISIPLRKTLISIEDQHFYSHNGLDYNRIIKSLFTNLKQGKIVEGASTLTQQLTRIALLNNEKSFTRKIMEMILSKKMEAKYNKDDILEMYFNIAFFGHNIYGIYNACSYYFSKLPKDIDYAEASVLVGIINSPNRYAPDINYSLCIEKQMQILSILKNRKIIDEETYQKAQKNELNFTFSKNDNHDHSYYFDAIRKELSTLGLNKNLNKEGLIITSYYDNLIQTYVNSIIKKYQHHLKEDEDIAVIIMKPYSNKVIALSGGLSYINSSFNRALDSKRQIGSTIKPIIYYLALNKGFTYKTEFLSKETTFHICDIGDYSPKNSNNKYANRRINLIEAIANSDNIYAMKSSLYLGSENIYSYLEEYSITSPIHSPTIALGTIEMSPLELCSIYNTFASEGMYYEPRFINTVQDFNNRTLYKDPLNAKRTMLRSKAIEMNYYLKSPFDKAFKSYTSPSLLSYQTKATFSAKTGTTDSSTWVCGFNKKYTICVYLGTDNNSQLSNAKIAKSIFQDLANSLCPIEIEFYDIPTNYDTFTLINKDTNVTSFSYIKERKLFA